MDNHLMGNDLPLPQVSTPTIEEDHNVGSLLRLSYQLEQNDYGTQNHRQVVPDLMSDCYQPPILDGISALDYL